MCVYEVLESTFSNVAFISVDLYKQTIHCTFKIVILKHTYCRHNWPQKIDAFFS